MFIAKLSRKYRDFSHASCLHICSFPAINILHQGMHLLQSMNLQWQSSSLILCGLYYIVQWPPTSRLWVGTSCQISGSISLEIKCIINVMTWIVPKPSPTPHPGNPGPTKNCLPWNQILVPKSLGTLDIVHSLAKNSMSFDRYIITWYHHYSITQNGFTALKILCMISVPPTHSSFPTPHHLPPRPWSFYFLPCFAFSRMSQSWN